MTDAQTAELVKFIIPVVMGALGGWGAVAMTVGRYKEKIEQLEKCCAGERISKIEGKFEFLQSYEPMVKRGSPLQLTDHGQKVISESGFSALIDSNEAEIVGFLSSCVTDTKYDVQDCSERACKYILNHYCLPNQYYIYPESDDYAVQLVEKSEAIDKYAPLVSSIKNWLYENGYKIEHLVEAGMVYVRDKAIPVIFTDA